MIGTLIALRKLNKNKSGRLSPKQILNGIVNLINAKKELTYKEYELVNSIYEEINKYKDKRLFSNFREFSEYLSLLICQFDMVVPYYKICGNSDYKNSISMFDEKEKVPFRQKAIEYLHKNIYTFEGDSNWDLMVYNFRKNFYGI